MPARLALYAAYILVILNLTPILGRATANVVEKSALVVAAVLFLAARPFSRPVACLMVATVALVVLLGAATIYPSFSWATVIVSLNQIVIVYVLLAIHPTDKDCDGFLQLAAWLPVASAVLGFAYQAAGIAPAFAVEFTSGLYRFQGSLLPAFLSGFAMCGAFSALQLGISGRKPIYYAVLAADFGILLAAGGRAPFAVALVVCAASLLLGRSINVRTKVTGILVGVGSLFFFILVFGEKLITRFQGSGDNGRLIMWGYLQTLIDQYPWTGIGFGHQYLSVPREVSIVAGSTAAHNDYYRLAVELGQIGMPVFYLFLTAAVLIVARRNRVTDWTVILAFGGFLFLSRTDNTLAAPSHFPLVILAAFASTRDAKTARGAIARTKLRPVRRFGRAWQGDVGPLSPENLATASRARLHRKGG
jgi:hypothetical protein